MTLVTSFTLNGCPIILSDLLLSQNAANPASDIQIPTSIQN